jgi:hypothetical protein
LDAATEPMAVDFEHVQTLITDNFSELERDLRGGG